ncbi:MAG: tagaturonate reductase [Ferruginibacter sp.]
MKLTKSVITEIQPRPDLFVPTKNVFDLPEKVLQFGTGVLLRALPDFIINSANNDGLFNGRIVVVKSTDNGNTDLFEEQDGLYTVCVRGIEDGKKVSEDHIIASVSRVLSAASEWDAVLECAANPDIQLIISNTTEVGITLIKDNIHADPPQSFPGKLLSFLYHRFKFFKGDETKGMVIVPTELIPFNADKLLSIVLELAHINNLESAFLDWLENANFFCNSLVDRIVPGKLNEKDKNEVENRVGYTDGLMIMSEVYSLWAIQSSAARVKELFSFASQKNGLIISDDINKFRELKLRLLNGSHTFSCGVAYLAGFDLVKTAMEDQSFNDFLEALMFKEMIPAIIGETISVKETQDFANKTLDRYRNTFIDHQWLSISLQFSFKMNLRNGFIIENYIQRFGKAPSLMAFGVAAYILFMRCTQEADGKFYGKANDIKYLVTDANASIFSEIWKMESTDDIVEKILFNETLFDINPASMKIFKEAVVNWLNIMLEQGLKKALQIADTKKENVE